MSENVIQSSFSAGELSPSLFARVDVAKYHSGAARMRNFFVDYRSGASTRPGTEFIRPTVQGFGPVRLVRFQQSVDVTYVLEFGNGYIRFISDGSSVVETYFTIDGISFGVPVGIDAPGHNFNDGDLVFISLVDGTPQINERYFIVRNPVGSGFLLEDSLTGSPIDGTNWSVGAGGGIVQRVYTIGTLFTSDILAFLKFSQKASVLNITSPFFPPYTLTLINATNWVLAPISVGSTALPVTGLTASATPLPSGSTASLVSYLIEVSSVDDNGQESAATSIQLNNVIDLRAVQGTITVSWDDVGAQAYNVYFSSPSLAGPVPLGSIVGFVGSTNSTTFLNSNVSPDFSQTPAIPSNPFQGVDANPQVSSYFQQRLVYANGGGDDVDRFWMSQPGAYNNFNISNPSQDSDSLDGRLVSLEVNEIKSLIPMPSGLIALTTKGAWQISGGAGGVATQGGPVTPTSLTATPQAYIGANDVPPILINYDIFFVQQKGSIVRDMSYNIYANIYTGNDVSILSSHLFYGHQIKEWAYAEEPFKIVWAVREDGILLSLTILKEQDMYGWARHDTRGNFRSVCTVTEGPNDATYFVIDRPNPLGGGTFVSCIERLTERAFQFGAEDAWSVDCGVSTVHNAPNANLTPMVQPDGTVVFTVDVAGTFDSSMVGWVIRAGGGIGTVTDVPTDTEIVATMIQPITDLIPNDPMGRANIIPSGSWSIDQPFTQAFGLDHLEGQQVSVLADGGVVNGLTVSGGSITLPQPATKVTVGYGFQAQLQTMYLDLGQETNTVQGKRKKVNALTVRVKDSRALKAGRTFGSVIPIKELNRVTVMGAPIPLITADERIVMDPLWDVPGQICLQVDDPLPCSVLGVIPEITVGDSAK